MEKTLNKIQKLAKVGLIVNKISLWCSIMGCVCCAILLIAQIIVGNTNLIGDSYLIDEYVKNNLKLSIGSVYAGLSVGIIMSGFGIVTSKAAVNFYKKELDLGTPFEIEVADGLKKLGLTYIKFSIISVLVAGITYSIFDYYLSNVGELDIGNGYSIGIGIFYLIISLLCRLGTQTKQANQ